MPKLNVDFSNVEDFDALPAGTYKIAVTEASVEEGGSGYPYIRWTLTVDEGEHENRKLFLNTSLSPKALFKLRDTLVGYGEDPETLDGSFDVDPDDYIGRRAIAAVVQRPYDGRFVNDVEAITPVGGARKTSSSTAGATSSAPRKPSLR